MKLFNYLALTRPANVITAISDIIAGVSIAGALSKTPLPVTSIIFLAIATSFLYAGGIVFNDVFDLEIDKIERPERIIPSGKLTKKQAITFGLMLMIAGIFMSSLVSVFSGFTAVAIAFFALLYDKFAKHQLILGPLTMGFCRGLNLILGMSVLANNILPEFWYISFLPIVFIAAITLTSQREVLGNNKLSVIFALILDLIVAGTIVLMAKSGIMNFWNVLPFVALWLLINLVAKSKAIRQNEPKNIMKAVKMGVLSLIPLNASYVAGFGDWKFGMAVLLLLPISIFLAKKFAVT
jgi:4-hydroxybenzoate polyprenyltransferase